MWPYPAMHCKPLAVSTSIDHFHRSQCTDCALNDFGEVNVWCSVCLRCSSLLLVCVCWLLGEFHLTLSHCATFIFHISHVQSHHVHLLSFNSSSLTLITQMIICCIAESPLAYPAGCVVAIMLYIANYWPFPPPATTATALSALPVLWTTCGEVNAWSSVCLRWSSLSVYVDPSGEFHLTLTTVPLLFITFHTFNLFVHTSFHSTPLL